MHATNDTKTGEEEPDECEREEQQAHGARHEQRDQQEQTEQEPADNHAPVEHGVHAEAEVVGQLLHHVHVNLHGHLQEI